MSTQTNFGPSFKTGIKNGKCPVNCVNAIANRNGKTPGSVWNNLKSKGFAWNFNFKGQKFWFPTFKPTGANGAKYCETQCWENMIQWALYKGWITPNQMYHWNQSQICWHVSNCFSNYYSKPRNFNPTLSKWNTPGPWHPVKKTGTKSTPKRKGRKTSPKRTKRYTGMRLVGGTYRKTSGRTRRYTTRKAA